MMFFSGLGGVLAKTLPQHWQRRANERLSDFNPYSVISGNHDLIRAARLAWIKATLEVLDAAKKSTQSSGRAFDDKNAILNFEDHTRKKLLEIRSAALDRRTDPGYSPIDSHLKTIIEETSEFIAPGEDLELDQSLTQDFGKTLGVITGWGINEIPSMFIQIARNGLPTVDKKATRTFGELVFAAFAEILKSPDQYPEAGAAFTIAMQNAARKLSEEILAYTRGIDEKVDKLITQAEALTIFQTGAQAYLEMLPQLREGQARIEARTTTIQDNVQSVKKDTGEIKEILHGLTQTAKANPAASEEEILVEYRKLLDHLDQREFKQVLDTVPDSLSVYRAQCIARWAQPRFAIDKRFTPLTLLLDQGEDNEGERYQRSREFNDLRDILTEVHARNEPVIVVAGAPGSGKSTLLRRLELDFASQALRSEDAAAKLVPLTIFLQLNAFGQRTGDIPNPSDWVAEHWARMTNGLLDFEALLRQPLILLLDGLNEMPHTNRDDYGNRLAAWKRFLDQLALNHPSVRIIFSCRTQDYGTKLTTKDLPRVPQVEITPLTSGQVENFLQVYSPDNAQQLWHQLKDSLQLDLYRSPYYLRLLIDQASDGQIPEGRAALFTGFVRAMLKREIDAENSHLRGNELLLTARDLQRIGNWRNAFELPRRGQLFNALAAFAFQLQTQRNDGDTGNTGNKMQVRIGYDDALDCLSEQISDEPQQETLLNAAVDLQILDMPGDDVLFVHQLLQEYFAARHVAEQLNAARKANDAQQYTQLTKLAATAWRDVDITPSMREALAVLPRSGTLPDLPTTGWEETFLLATAMTDAPDDFLRALAEVNLPLAGRCAAQPDVKISDQLRKDLQQQLVERSRDPATDLRARIYAGHALGALGDPRFEPRQGPLGRYLLPPMVAIEGGSYHIGSDEGVDDDEAPRHEVQLASFALGQFPVTNAEFKCFINAGGYQENRWWDTSGAQRWQRGEGTGEGAREFIRQWRNRFINETNLLSLKADEHALTKEDIKKWQDYCSMTDEAFEAMLTDRYRDKQHTHPAFWNEPAYNALNQPVVGICWFEARAYCNWLSHQTGQLFCLPTEAQWEAAASGRKGRRYAWGNKIDATLCNALAAKLRRTTPVGVFPAGDTPSPTSNNGMADLIGNIWEWTSSCYVSYPYQAYDGREAVDSDLARVFRGGSWFILPDFVRAAARGNAHPGSRINGIGFRVLCSSPIE